MSSALLHCCVTLAVTAPPSPLLACRLCPLTLPLVLPLVRCCQAIGARNVLESEAENRKRKQHELQYLIAQKQLEIQRCQEYHASLAKVEHEQKTTLERLART